MGQLRHASRDLSRIKLDLTTDETSPSIQSVVHTYSDLPAWCYCFEEVFGEKIRTLGERARPRDLYDVINLFRNGESHAAVVVIRDVVRQKGAFKSMSFPTMEALATFRDELVGEWGDMLSHQSPALPPVESFWDALPEFFGWLTAGNATSIGVAAYLLATGDHVLRVPAGAITILGRSTPAIEVIRFAGSNRLCVDLDYVDEKANAAPLESSLTRYARPGMAT